MNKTKKELYEENKRLKNTLNTYSYFWETDAIDESIKQMKFTKKILYIASVIFLIIIAFFNRISKLKESDYIGIMDKKSR